MSDDGIVPGIIRVDGGMVANNWFLQFLADMLNIPVERPKNVESTVLGAAYLAGLQCGVFSSIEQIADLWSREAVFAPQMDASDRAGLYAGWQDAVQRVRTNPA
jgi:glycerol kinase